MPAPLEANRANVRHLLDVATAHVPSRYDIEQDFGSHRAVIHDHGWIVYVGSGPNDETPEWLRPILELAQRLDCTVIDFDEDADELDGVAIYDENGILVPTQCPDCHGEPLPDGPNVATTTCGTCAGTGRVSP